MGITTSTRKREEGQGEADRRLIAKETEDFYKKILRQSTLAQIQE